MSKLLDIDKMKKLFSCKPEFVNELSSRMAEKEIDSFNSLADEKLKKVAKELATAAKNFIAGYNNDDKNKIAEAIVLFNANVKNASKKTAELKPPVKDENKPILPPPASPPSTTTPPVSSLPAKEEISDEELLAAADLITSSNSADNEVASSDFTGEELVELPNILDIIFKVEEGDGAESENLKTARCPECDIENTTEANFCRNCGEILERKNKVTVVLGEDQKNVLVTFCPNDSCPKFSAFFKPDKKTKFCTACRTKLLQMVVETVDNTPIPAGIVQKIFSFFSRKKK